MMESFISRLAWRNLIDPPLWVIPNIVCESIVGSHALGIPLDTSDVDLFCVCIPPTIFGKDALCYQNHSVQVESQEYDLNVYHIGHFFHLCTEGHPIALWSLFNPPECVLYETKVGSLIRESRNLFCIKAVRPEFMSYASTRWGVVLDENPRPRSSREQRIKAYGFDTKGAYHAVLAIGAIKHLLITGDLDFRLNIDYLKAIRQGKIAQANVWDWMEDEAIEIAKAHEASQLPDGPDHDAISKLYSNCLEEHRP